ncbi:putative uncharacterized protein DDB_G0286901 [Symsagittifera roscoffensis]|uniref:putative uncharacterized protein DDB_G0286901 n=1 Tax=Symsagittifera roscoffensis TaxID=84072 RepID=UPI00307C3746
MTSLYLSPNAGHLLDLLFDSSKKVNREAELQLCNRSLPQSFFTEPGSTQSCENQFNNENNQPLSGGTNPARLLQPVRPDGCAGLLGSKFIHSKSKSSPSVNQLIVSGHGRAASVQQLDHSPNRRVVTGVQLSPNYNNNNNNVEGFSPCGDGALSSEHVAHLESLKNDKNFIATVHQLAEQLELPEGWAMQFTQAKESYFVDHVNKSTTWIDPRIAIAEAQLLNGEAKQLKIRSQISQIIRRKQQLQSHYFNLDKQESYLRKALEDDLACLSLSPPSQMTNTSPSPSTNRLGVGGSVGRATISSGPQVVHHRQSNSCSSLLDQSSNVVVVGNHQNVFTPPPAQSQLASTTISHDTTANELMQHLVGVGAGDISGSPNHLPQMGGLSSAASSGCMNGLQQQHKAAAINARHYRQSSADSGVWTGPAGTPNTSSLANGIDVQRRMSCLSHGGSYDTNSSSCVSSPGENTLSVMNTHQQHHLPSTNNNSLSVSSQSQPPVLHNVTSDSHLNQNNNSHMQMRNSISAQSLNEENYGYIQSRSGRGGLEAPQRENNQSSVIVSMEYIQQQHQQQQMLERTIQPYGVNQLQPSNQTENSKHANEQVDSSCPSIGGCLIESLVVSGESAMEGMNSSVDCNSFNNNLTMISSMDTDEDEFLHKLIDDYSIYGTQATISNNQSGINQSNEDSGNVSGGSNGLQLGVHDMASMDAMSIMNEGGGLPIFH